MTDDARFASRLHTDPRFKRAKQSKHKVVLDDRFKQIFNEDEDDTTGQGGRRRKVDKYGRKLASGDRNAERQQELKRFYRLKDDELDEHDEQDRENDTEKDDDDNEAEQDDGEQDEGKPTMMDYARGQVLMESSDEEDEQTEQDDSTSSSSGDSSEDEEAVTLAPAHLRRRQASRSPSIDLSETELVFGKEQDDGATDEDDEEGTGADPTRRVAVVNMDWDHIRASDLYRVLASSLSATASSTTMPAAMKGKNGQDKLSSKLSIAPGRLLHLRIYPSQFGRERMEKEEREGPPIEVFGGAKEDSDEDEDHETLVLGRMKARVKKSKSKRKQRANDSDEQDDSEPETELTTQDLIREQLNEGDESLDNEALRKYQLERLRYYYAVATFDTPTAAAHVVSQVQGTEFERTANVLDLQYVPDEVSFEDDPVHDEATEASVAAEGSSYQANDYVTDALRHSKVKLTWDADDPHRKSKINSVLDSIYGKGKNKKGGRDINDEELRVFIASSSDEGERHPDGDDEDEHDDFFERGEESVKDQGKDKRSKMRALLGLDELEQQAWDGSKAVAGKGGKGRGEEMQITFAPALSSKKGALDSDSDGDQGKQETSIEKYKRKEKERRERKKAERQAKRGGKPVAGPEDGGEDTGPGGFDDDFFVDDGRDPFAAYDAGEIDSGDEAAANKGKKLSKAEKRKARQAAEDAAKEGQAELELLVGSDDEDAADSKHFDMRKIVKAEKNKGKKKRTRGKKADDSAEAVNDTFEIDLKDDRFKSVHEDYDFAIDPTNPKFQKTRNMQALLSEGRKRRAKKQDVRAPVALSATPSTSAKSDNAGANGGEDNLRRLIESVKRKAGDEGGRGKRTKV
ncbi:pre-rRNA-processing protein esf1 [Microbotryomycetes sp. JL201]|nr:pre-rRNA-processing protein esf1 [Microbotryomycetes sp. JL201]